MFYIYWFCSKSLVLFINYCWIKKLKTYCLKDLFIFFLNLYKTIFFIQFTFKLRFLGDSHLALSQKCIGGILSVSRPGWQNGTEDLMYLFLFSYTIFHNLLDKITGQAEFPALYAQLKLATMDFVYFCMRISLILVIKK